jgi:aromatic-L-amino-acid decarboxylase
MNAEEFRKYGHTLIDWLADNRSGIADRPVQASTQPGEVRALLPRSPPGHPEPFDAVIADLDAVVLPPFDALATPCILWLLPRK